MKCLTGGSTFRAVVIKGFVLYAASLLGDGRNDTDAHVCLLYSRAKKRQNGACSVDRDGEK